MSCTNPLLAVDFGINNLTGKHRIKLLPSRLDFSMADYKSKYGDMLLQLPCGKCDACIMARRKLWSLRCYAESLYHDHNCFVTLTYDDDHLPNATKSVIKKTGEVLYRDHPLQKTDFQKFIKSLRNSGIKVRYYGCGEYGSKTGRPHYHLILFGYFPKDYRYDSKTKSGIPQFTSKFLTDLWAKGRVTFQEFSPEAAAYVAGYVDKKYKVRDCFTLMSKKPGLGEQYFYDHYRDFYKSDSIVTNFGSHLASIPRYFDKLAEKIGFDITDLKNVRIDYLDREMYEEMRKFNVVNYEEVMKRKAEFYKDKLTRKKRNLL